MLSRYLQRAAFAAAVVQTATAQGSKIVPQDLQGGFEDSGREVQVSYTNNAVTGFQDGTTFEKDEVSKEPTFALGDSSGITPGLLFTILMVDTTCENARTLHYVRPNFQLNGDIVNIESQSNALLDYQAPGSLGETGDDRQYSFLMYTNPRRSEINDLKLPGEGENFDAQKFQDDNGLQDPSAGVGMVVKLGGQANCDGNAAAPAPSNSPQSSGSGSGEQPASATSAAEQPSPATSAAEEPASATSEAAQPSTPASGGLGSSPSTAASGVSSAATPSPTDDSEEQPQSTGSQASQTGEDSNDSSPSATPSVTGGASTGGSAATGAGETGTGATGAPTLLTSTVVASGSQPEASGAVGSGTSTSAPAVQTENAAPGLSMTGGAVVAPLLAVAGLLAW